MTDDPEIDALSAKWFATRARVEREKREETQVTSMFDCPGGAVFVIVENGCVLMERCPKKAAMFGGEWFIPGGKIEVEETPREACDREAGEEIGIRIVAAEPQPVLNGAPNGMPFFPLYPFTITAYAGTVPPESLDASVPLAWVSIKEALRSRVAVIPIMVRAALATTLTVCEYCFNAPAHHDPVLGWICTPCETKITEGDDDAD